MPPCHRVGSLSRLNRLLPLPPQTHVPETVVLAQGYRRSESGHSNGDLSHRALWKQRVLAARLLLVAEAILFPANSQLQVLAFYSLTTYYSQVLHSV